jgi:hypothetical protein
MGSDATGGEDKNGKDKSKEVNAFVLVHVHQFCF